MISYMARRKVCDKRTTCVVMFDDIQVLYFCQTPVRAEVIDKAEHAVEYLACSVYGRNENCIQIIGRETWGEEDTILKKQAYLQEIILKSILEKYGMGDVDWIHLAQYRDHM